jgi:hypothetical protein
MRERQQIMLFLFFPVGAVAGMLLSWKWEGLSGLLTLTCLFVFFVLFGQQYGTYPPERSISFLPLRGFSSCCQPWSMILSFNSLFPAPADRKRKQWQGEEG